MPRALWIDFMKISYLFLVWRRFALALHHFSCVLKIALSKSTVLFSLTRQGVQATNPNLLEGTKDC